MLTLLLSTRTGSSGRRIEGATLIGRERWRNDVTYDFAFPLVETEDVVVFGAGWDEFCYGLTVFGDDDSLVFGLDFVQDSQAFCFEGSRSYFFHDRPSLDTTTIITPRS
jgi:hypothetical protein